MIRPALKDLYADDFEDIEGLSGSNPVVVILTAEIGHEDAPGADRFFIYLVNDAWIGENLKTQALPQHFLRVERLYLTGLRDLVCRYIEKAPPASSWITFADSLHPSMAWEAHGLFEEEP